MSRIFRIGLTGGIASGKSAVAARFAEHGIPVIDADVIARQIVQPGSTVLATLRTTFGDEILDAGGALDRAAMRARVFGNAGARAKLESILHPVIRAQMNTQAQTAGGPYQIFAIPLLVETQAQSTVDRVLVVDCDRASQLKRLMARDDATQAQAQAILATQASREERLAIADDVLVNDSDLSSLRDKVDRLHEKYLDLAARRLREPAP
jgi:dephospho-CoA kinase